MGRATSAEAEKAGDAIGDQLSQSWEFALKNIDGEKISGKASGAKELMTFVKVPDISREKLPPTGGGSGLRYETVGAPEKTHSHTSLQSQPGACSPCTLSVIGYRGHP